MSWRFSCERGIVRVVSLKALTFLSRITTKENAFGGQCSDGSWSEGSENDALLRANH